MRKLTSDEADCIVEYIRAMEDCKGNAPAVERHLESAGYKLDEVDAALRELGGLAGRDCSLF